MKDENDYIWHVIQWQPKSEIILGLGLSEDRWYLQKMFTTVTTYVEYACVLRFVGKSVYHTHYELGIQ